MVWENELLFAQVSRRILCIHYSHYQLPNDGVDLPPWDHPSTAKRRDTEDQTKCSSYSQEACTSSCFPATWEMERNGNNVKWLVDPKGPTGRVELGLFRFLIKNVVYFCFYFKPQQDVLFSFSRSGVSILKISSNPILSMEIPEHSAVAPTEKHPKHHQNIPKLDWSYKGCAILSRCFLQNHFSPHQGVWRTKALNGHLIPPPDSAIGLVATFMFVFCCVKNRIPLPN